MLKGHIFKASFLKIVVVLSFSLIFYSKNTHAALIPATDLKFTSQEEAVNLAIKITEITKNECEALITKLSEESKKLEKAIVDMQAVAAKAEEVKKLSPEKTFFTLYGKVINPGVNPVIEYMQRIDKIYGGSIKFSEFTAAVKELNKK